MIQRPQLLWLGRAMHGLWPDHNPLRRRFDRAEAAIIAGLLAGFLAGAPVAALATGHWAYTSSLRTERTQQASRQQIPAVLLEDAPAPIGWAHGSSWKRLVRASWAAPDGAPLTGKITVTAGARAGSTVSVWSDASGRLHSPPLRHVQVTGRSVFALVLTPILLGLLLLGVGALAHRAIDRRRLAAWAADWRGTGPHWTRRR